LPTPFKEYLSLEFMNHFSDALQSVRPDFNKNELIDAIFNDNYARLELKERMRHITLRLAEQLPSNYKEAIHILIDAQTEVLKKDLKLVGLELIFLPDFVQVFGLDDFETSIDAMETITRTMSCEFAVRPFIVKYEDTMMTVLYKWSKHENHHIRRLASEGSRPRLPWAMALPEFKKDPSPILLILENLKNDSSEYVRRSVANNLNDISKDHPELVLNIAKKWQGKGKETDKLIKHAMRTLLKSNFPGSIQLFGYSAPKNIEVNNFKVDSTNVQVGKHLTFSFSIKNKDKKEAIVRIEYAVHFLLANGKNTRKVFKISERKIGSEEEIKFIRKHSFRIITTRKYYSGKHFVSLIVNGEEKIIGDFDLYY